MRAPIFYALSPVLLGISVNSITDSSYGMLLILLISVSAGVILHILNKQYSIFCDKFVIGIILGGFLCGYILLSANETDRHVEVPYDLREMPPRELSLDIEVKEVNVYFYKRSKRTITFKGTINKAPQIRADLIGKTVMCKTSRYQNPNIHKGDELNINGILKYYEKKKDALNKFNDSMDYIMSSVVILSRDPNNKIQELKFIIKNLVVNNNYISKECAGFLMAFIFGNKELLELHQLDLFKKTSTMHLFAVSGLHIGLAFVLVNKILNMFIIRSLFLLPICLVIIFFYVQLVGYPVSACRAFLMIVIWRSSKVVFRKSNPLSALGWSALLLLTFMPEQMFSMGFQLSFTVVLTIIWIINNLTKPGTSTLLNLFKISFIISYSVFFGSLLLAVDKFHFINPISIFLNGLLMVFITIVFVACISYIFIQAIYPCPVITKLLNYIYTLIEETLVFFNSFQFSHLHFDLDFDIPDGIHLLWVFVLLSTINLFKRLWFKLAFLSFLPIFFLLVTLFFQ